MKKFTLILSLILGLGIFLSFSTPAQQTIRDAVPSLQYFDAVHVGSAINVVISDAYRNVEIECTPEMRRRLDIDVVNGVLNMGLRPGTHIRASRITVYLPMRAYRHIKAMSASKVNILNPVTTENIIFDLSSAAKITGSVNAAEVQIFANTASKITLSGTANVARIEATTSSGAVCRNLRSRRAVCNSTTAARVSVYASESFEGDAASASRIDCYGNPVQRQTRASSAGKINFR